MKRSSWIILGLVCVLAIALMIIRATSRAPLSDEEQIHLLLGECESAVEHKDLKRAFAHVSRDYSDEAGFAFETLRLQAIQAFRIEGRYDILLEDTAILVSGETAEVKTRASVSLISDGDAGEVFSGPLTIALRREKSTRWVVLPTKQWKVVSISGLPAALEE